MTDLLVVAGEASGDRAAAGVVSSLGTALRGRSLNTFGLGGGALSGVGVELLADLRDTTAMGLGEVVPRSLHIARAAVRVLAAAVHRKPQAALLVNYSEFNGHLAPRLRQRGIPVLWYGAPQVWAWRPGRATSLRRGIDRLAVVLPFEEELWRKAGVDAHYVGHPALETTRLPRPVARRALGLTPFASTVAILPGSRPHEVRRLLVPMLQAYEPVRFDRASLDARVLLAPSLDDATARWARAQAQAFAVETLAVDAVAGAASVLTAFDVALCASGTASLEATLAGAVPVVAYRVGVATEMAARFFLRTPRVALPNVLLGRHAFPELLQDDAEPRRLGEALGRALRTRTRLLGECAAVEQVLRQGAPPCSPSHAVADMLMPWLTGGVIERPPSPPPSGLALDSVP